MKNIIVTGGAGYIGSHTCVELINAGHNPIIIDNFSNSEKFIVNRIEKITGQSVHLIEEDCRDTESILEQFNKLEIAGCIHFAAFKAVGESANQPLKYFDNNLNSLLSILRICEGLKIKNLVFSSSCTVYGQPDTLPVTEQSPIQPAESPYGRTKQMGEDMISDYVSSGKELRALSLRYFNPIGAHPSGLIGELPLGVPNNLVPFITQTAAGLRKSLTIFGNDYDTPDGTCIRDYIHVVDLAKAHVKALDRLESQTSFEHNMINVGTGQGSSVKEVVDGFEEVNNLELPVMIGNRRPGDVVAVYADTSKANDYLGWKSELDLRKALKDAWNWQQTLAE